MCGVTGFSGNFDLEILKSSINILSHRGPDDHGFYIDNDKFIGLGHTRLSILDLSKNGHQPMMSSDEKNILVFNGEIYNFKDLKSMLQKEGYNFKSTSDTEVLLYLYQNKGIEFLKMLNGIFSIGIYDVKTNELIIMRDGLGIKPLYYFSDSNNFAFSSEIKALLPFMEGNTDINFNSINRHLTYLWNPGEDTLFNSIKKVEPGYYLVIKDGKIKKKNKWFELPQSKKNIKYTNRKDAIMGVTNSLKNAVKRQLVSDVPVGAFLSGGLDSSSLVALAKDVQKIDCFTIEPFGGSDIDTTNDLPYAKEVAKYLKVNLNIVKINSEKLSNDLEQMVWQLDEPLADPAALNVLYIAREAKKMGIKVLLSGSGGDDIYTGYRRHIAFKYDSIVTMMPMILRKQLENFTNSLDKRKTMGRRFSKLFENATLNGDEKIISYLKWTQPQVLSKLYTKKLKDNVCSAKTDKPMRDFLMEIDDTTHPIDKMLLVEQRFFLADHNLIYTDKMSMAAGIEVRVPFLDNEVLEAAAKLPINYKISGANPKWILKKAMEGYLPKNIIYRKKSGFGAPLRRWMKYELRDMVSKYLSRESLTNRGLFNYEEVIKLINDNDKGINDASYTLFSLICIEIWCRRFIK